MMDSSFNEEQEAVKDLAKQILEGTVSPDRLKEMKANGEYLDRKAWQELANANLVGIAIPEAYGGSGLGFLEACLVLEQIGRNVAPVPYYASVVLGALPVATFGTEAQKQELLPPAAAGDLILSAALIEIGAQPEQPTTVARRDGDGWRLDGQKDFVAAGLDAGQLLVSASTDDGVGVFIIDPKGPGVTIERQAAWRLAEGLPAAAEVATAKFWAAEGGQRVVAAAQHLHGGIGVDRDYPLHRYYLWAKWIQLNLGGAAQQLRKLGLILANEPV